MPNLSGRYTASDKMTNTGVSVTSVAQACSPDDILDTHDAAAYLRLSVSSLNKMRCTGSGPAFIRMGRSVRYRRRALDSFIDSRCATSTTDADHRLPTRLSESLVTAADGIGPERRIADVARPLGTNNGQAPSPSRPAAKGAASTRGAS
jgi:predicted DNA-binding transcriptional regulator AlpA